MKFLIFLFVVTLIFANFIIPDPYWLQSDCRKAEYKAGMIRYWKGLRFMVVRTQLIYGTCYYKLSVESHADILIERKEFEK